MPDELKPCPFCGRTPYLNEIPPHTHMLPGLPDCEGECFVECNCTCCMSAKDREEAIEKWNTRVGCFDSLPRFPHRLTVDIPVTNLDRVNNYAFADEGIVKLRYASGKNNVDICDLIANASKRDCDVTSKEVFEGACFECDTDNCIYGICYVLSVQAAELRERLKQYEDKLNLPCFEEYISNTKRNKKGKAEMKNTVTEQQVKEILNNSEIEVRTVYGKVTVVCCKLPNGFVITEASGAVDPANYDEEIGKQICMERIENKIWELEGYALSKKLAEQQDGNN